MNNEKGNTIIGTIALIAVAVLVGIWIGAKRDIIITEIDEGVTSIQTTLSKPMKKGDEMPKGEEKKEMGEEESMGDSAQS